MTSHQTDDVVKEYLAHVERLVSDLPLLQRRELLVDLETHISTARIENGAQSEAEVLAILERLGSPEVVAAAAHEEAPASQVTAKTGPPRRRLGTPLVIFMVILVLLTVFTVCIGVSLISSRDGSSIPVPDPAPAVSSPN